VLAFGDFIGLVDMMVLPGILTPHLSNEVSQKHNCLCINSNTVLAVCYW